MKIGKPSKFDKDGYEDAPRDIQEAMENSIPVKDDFLPSPEYLAELLAKEKISLNVDKKALESFRAYAKKHGLKYQALMNQVLSNYAQKLN